MLKLVSPKQSAHKLLDRSKGVSFSNANVQNSDDFQSMNFDSGECSGVIDPSHSWEQT